MLLLLKKLLTIVFELGSSKIIIYFSGAFVLINGSVIFRFKFLLLPSPSVNPTIVTFDGGSGLIICVTARLGWNESPSKSKDIFSSTSLNLPVWCIVADTLNPRFLSSDIFNTL